MNGRLEGLYFIRADEKKLHPTLPNRQEGVSSENDLKTERSHLESDPRVKRRRETPPKI